MNSKTSPHRSASASIRLIVGLAICLLIPVLLFAAAPTWWTTQGVFNGNPENDYAAVNQGQVKNIAVLADQELDENFWQFADTTTIDALAVTLTGTTPNTNDYAAVNLGQLKTLAQPFFDVLLAGGYRGHPLESGTYPWLSPSVTSTNDYAMANIGQVKNLFSFDDTLSSDGSGLPDWWEHEYGITLGSGTTATSLAPRDDGLTYMDAYYQGLNPKDFFNGQAPTVSIVSGSGQIGTSGTFVPQPLVVSVTDVNNNPLANAPVTFNVILGGGTLQAIQSGPSGSSLTVNANSYGRVIVYFKLPSSQGTTCQITCAPACGNYLISGTFTEQSDGGTGTYPSPVLPSGTSNNLPDVPVQSYAAIDVSGGVTSGNNVSMIALDDSNNMSFAYTDSEYNTYVYTWANGSSALYQTVSPYTVADISQGYPAYNNITPVVTILTPSGKVYGELSKDFEDDSGVYGDNLYTEMVGFSSVPDNNAQGAISQIGVGANDPSDEYFGVYVYDHEWGYRWAVYDRDVMKNNIISLMRLRTTSSDIHNIVK